MGASTANRPFGVAGEHVGVFEEVLDNAIAKFVKKYSNSPSLKRQDFNVLACAGSLEHEKYSHQVYIFKIIQLKVIPTKKTPGSMYRIYTPPHVLFSVKDLEKVDLSEFMHQFTFFEAISLHLLCLTEASSLKQYISLQEHYSKMTLKSRLSLIADSYLENDSKSSVKELSFNILHVRNQIAHSLSPLQITYKNKGYDTNNSILMESIKDSMNSAMNALVLPYLKSQQKLVKWLSPELSLEYAEALRGMETKR